jgi:hypothetical protein
VTLVPGLLWRRGLASDLFREDEDQAMHIKAIKENSLKAQTLSQVWLG